MAFPGPIQRGTLRATMQHMGLIKGSEKISASDLAAAKARGGPLTQKRVALAMAFAKGRATQAAKRS
jgi:hypothetical protein